MQEQHDVSRWALSSLMCCALFAAGPLSAEAQTAEARGQEIARELERRNEGFADMSAELDMTLRDADGGESRRAMRIRVLEREAADEGDYSLILFDRPSDIRGTALLSHAGISEGDQQWLYLPALRRARRISSSRTSSPFMGSELAFEDITGTETGKHSWRYLGTERCGNFECFRVETRPRYEGSGYRRRVLWIDSSEYRIHKIEFFDQRDERLKTMTYGSYRRFGRFWRALEWRVVNHQNRRETRIAFTDVRFGSGFGERDFTVRALERAR